MKDTNSEENKHERVDVIEALEKIVIKVEML